MLGTNQNNAEWILQHRDAVGVDLPLTDDEVTFGRGRHCTFSMRSQYLSRQHAVMMLRNEKWRIKDLGSSNGVFIGSLRIRPHEEVVVNEGQLIGLGMPCNYTRGDFNSVYKLVRRPNCQRESGNSNTGSTGMPNIVTKNDVDPNQSEFNMEQIPCPVENGIIDVIDSLEIAHLNVESSGIATAENAESSKVIQKVSKRKIVNKPICPQHTPEIVDLASSDSEDDQMDVIPAEPIPTDLASGSKGDNSIGKCHNDANKALCEVIQCQPSTSTGITHSVCHSPSIAPSKAANGLSLASKTDEVNLSYSQDDEVIVISDDDDDDVDDDHSNLLKIKKEPIIKQESNEYDEGYLYKQRLWDQIDWSDGSQAFSSDCGNLDDLVKNEPHEWKDEWISSPDINIVEDDTNKTGDVALKPNHESNIDNPPDHATEARAKIAFVSEFSHLSLQIDETCYQEENYQNLDLSPVVHPEVESDVHSNISQCFSAKNNLEDGGQHEIANPPDINTRLLAMASSDDITDGTSDDFFPVLSQEFGDESDDNDAAEPHSTIDIPEVIPESVSGKQRIAHDRLKHSASHRFAPTIQARPINKQTRGRPRNLSFPQELPNPKVSPRASKNGESTRRRILRVYNHRVPMQGGGSDIRKSDVTPAAAHRADDILPRNASAFPTTITAKISATGTSDNVCHGETKAIEEQKKTVTKVLQRTAASRNDLLAQSITDESAGNRPKKRIQFTNANQIPSKRLRSSSDSFVANNAQHFQKLTRTNRIQTANATSKVSLSPVVTRYPKSVDEHKLTDGQSNQSPVGFPVPVINTTATAITTNQFRQHPHPACEQRDPRLARPGGGNSAHPSPSENKKQVKFDESRNETRIYQPIVGSSNGFNGRHVGNNGNNIITKRNVGDRFISDVLQWRPAWIEEQKTLRDPPPILASGQVKNVTISYKTVEEYEKTYGQLIKLECWGKLTDEYAMNSNLCSFQVVATSTQQETVNDCRYTKIHGYGVTNNKGRQFWRHGWLGILSVNVKPNGQFGSSNKNVLKPMFAFIDVCENCNVEELKLNPSTPLLLGNMLKNRDNFVFKLTIRVRWLVDEVAKDRSMRLQFASYLLPEIRLYEATHQLENRILKNYILRPDVNFFSLLKKQSSPRPNFDGRGLNESQKNVVMRTTEMCLASPTEPSIGLIHGPPGTGKTKVIIEVIREILVTLAGKVKILVCAPSNGAVDEITSRVIVLRQQLKQKNISVHLLRIGQCGNMHDNVREFTMDEYLERRKKIMKEKENVNSGENLHFIRQKIVSGANVITTTLGSCTRAEMDGLKLSDRIICIMDEATQCVEPEAILPMIYPFQKLILVGDHKQLPATIKSQTALTYGYNRSLFERLYLSFKEKENRPLMMLTIQHRMHHELCVYPSRKFYHDELRTAENLVQLGERYPFCFYRVINVCDGQEMRLEKDIFNQNEVEFVLKLANTILDMHRINIGIITFYSGQKKALEDSREILLGEKSKYVEVNTVDAFQGREKDVVILSAVRANPSGSVGFTCNSNRLNVALTRARYGLYIVGHKDTLQSNPDWNDIFCDARRRNVYAGASSRFSKELIAKIIGKK